MSKLNKRLKRKRRVRSKVFGYSQRPRLSVFRSNKHMFAQVINDEKGITLVSVSDSELKNNSSKSSSKNQSKKTQAGLLGELMAKKALAKKIKKIVFDRNGYRYHGRIKDFADGTRKGGLDY